MNESILSLEEMQNTEFRMLEYFDSVCRGANIDYCLAYGSALGAYRHGGFIPWDDDMDVYIRRSDSKRLFDLLDKYGNGRYKVLRPCESQDYLHPYAKLTDCATQLVEPNNKKVNELGVFIDLFPCDMVEDNANKTLMKFKIINLLNKVYCQVFVRSHERSSFLARTISGLLSMIAEPSKAHNQIEHLIEGAAKDDGNYLVCPYDADYVIPKEWVFPACQLKFEQKQFCIPGNIERYLESMYGADYMTPIKESNSFHGVARYRWKDEC